MLHDLGIGLVDFINRGRAPPVETSIGVRVALLDEQGILEELFVFIRGLVKYRAMCFLHHSHSVPGQFAILAITGDKHVALGLQHAKVAWGGSWRLRPGQPPARRGGSCSAGWRSTFGCGRERRCWR